jgi:hypothetical protein
MLKRDTNIPPKTLYVLSHPSSTLPQKYISVCWEEDEKLRVSGKY